MLTARTYMWKTADRWNNLPLHLRTELRISKFKTGVKRWSKDRRAADPGT